MINVNSIQLNFSWYEKNFGAATQILFMQPGDSCIYSKPDKNRQDSTYLHVDKSEKSYALLTHTKILYQVQVYIAGMQIQIIKYANILYSINVKNIDINMNYKYKILIYIYIFII